jgi:hypothetical protein
VLLSFFGKKKKLLKLPSNRQKKQMLKHVKMLKKKLFKLKKL